ncbi:MAG: hypothetical protein WC273_01070 [Dehalococcoidia bacterium]
MGTGMLKGHIQDGPFESEVILTFKDEKGREVSVIAPRSLVGGQAIRVRILATAAGRSLVELPGDVFGAGQEVTVREEILEAV